MGFIAKKSLAAKMKAALLCLALCISSGALAAEFTQEGAQKTAEQLNHLASDDSLQASSNSAMMAIMNLSALNIPGAFSNGYRAYGQYINSEKLDNMEAKAISNKGAMNSIGSVVAAQAQNAAAASGRATSFSRLDPSYLYKGESAAVAEEFEKRSGMRREEFLKQLGEATDSDLTWDDPSLMQKLEGRFQKFTNAIPNKDFKKGLETAASMMPAAARSEALGKLASFYSDSWKGLTPAPVAAGLPETAPASAPAPVQAAQSPAEENRAPASVAAEDKMSISSQAGQLLGINQNSDALKDLLSSADGNDSDSLFRKVSNRYRLLTPELVGKR
jgi:hypothetical protein